MQEAFQVEQCTLAHNYLRKVQEPLPEYHLELAGDAHLRALIHGLAALYQILEVVLCLLALLLRMNADIGLVVDLPAPSVVVERTDCHYLLIENVGLCVQDLLVRLGHLETFFDQPSQ